MTKIETITDISKDPVKFIQFLADNNPLGLVSVMKAAGYSVNDLANSVQVLNQLYIQGDKENFMKILNAFPYNNDNENYTGGFLSYFTNYTKGSYIPVETLVPKAGSASRTTTETGTEPKKSLWLGIGTAILGAAAPILGGLLGNKDTASTPVVVQTGNENMLKYILIGVGFLFVSAVIIVLIIKKTNKK